MGVERDIQRRVHMCEPSRSGETSVSGEGPAQSALPRVARNLAPHTRNDDHRLQDHRSGSRLQRLIEQFQDRHPGGRSTQRRQIVHAEEHSDGEGPGGQEANGDGAHDGNGHHAFGVCDLLGHVRGTVEAGKGPVRVDEADDEGDAVLLPAGGVDKVGEDEGGRLLHPQCQQGCLFPPVSLRCKGCDLRESPPSPAQRSRSP